MDRGAAISRRALSKRGSGLRLAVFLGLSTLLVFLGSVAGSATPVASPDDSTRPATAPDSFAVLELFTSENMRSCLAADSVLASLADWAETTGRPVFTLAYHVDLWNQVGWIDPWSDPAYSQRLRDYAARLNNGKTYTPMLIVDGVAAFPGSREQEARETVETALRRHRETRLSLAQSAPHNGEIVVAYTLTQPMPGDQLCVAVLERGVTSTISGGELTGSTLHHDHLVRAFKVRDLADGMVGEVRLVVPEDLIWKNASVIGLLQNFETLEIHAAARATIRAAAPTGDLR